MTIQNEHTLAFLLAFDGRIHHLEQGYWLKFEIVRTDPTKERPHGLRYSFTLHNPDGKRLVGFDNANAVPSASRYGAKMVRHDHWHRTEEDEGRHYPFTDAETLLADFFAEVRRVLDERGVSEVVIGEGVMKGRTT